MRRKKRRKKGTTRRRWWRRRRRRRRRGRRDDAVVSPGARGTRSGLVSCRPRPGAPHMPGPFLPGLGPFPPRGPLGPGASAAAVCGPGAAARAAGAPRFLSPHRVSTGGDSDTAFALLSPPLRSRSGNLRDGGGRVRRPPLAASGSGRTEGRDPRVCPSLAPAAKGEALFPQPRRGLSRCDHAGSFFPVPGQEALGHGFQGAPRARRAALGTPRSRRLRAAPPAGGRAHASLPPSAGSRGACALAVPCRDPARSQE